MRPSAGNSELDCGGPRWAPLWFQVTLQFVNPSTEVCAVETEFDAPARLVDQTITWVRFTSAPLSVKIHCQHIYYILIN